MRSIVMSKENEIVKEVKEMDRDDFIEFVKSIQEEPKEEDKEK